MFSDTVVSCGEPIMMNSSDMLSDSLLTRRKQAAIASGGVSSDPIYRAALASLEQFGARGSVLDFGGGRGAFARLLHETGRFDPIIVADLLEAPGGHEAGIHGAQCDLNGPLPFVDSSFDTVTAIEIIEHLENPRHVFREIARVLRPGGVAVISTPNCENVRSYLSLLLRGHHWAFGPRSYPAHITALLRRDLDLCAKEAGLVEVAFFWTDHGGIPRFPHITWQSVSGGWLRGRLFSDNVLVLARKPGHRLA